MDKCGIYKITNTVSGNIYIGSSVSVYRRRNCHLHELRNKKHSNDRMQKAFNKHTESAFKFEIIEECEIINRIEREQYYIDSLKPEYNLAPFAGNNYGVKQSLESRIKRKSLKNRLGIKSSDETKKRNSAASLRMYANHPELREAKRKLLTGNTNMRGRTSSEETKLLISKNKTKKLITKELIEYIKANYKPRDREFSGRALSKRLSIPTYKITMIINNTINFYYE